MTAVRPYPPDWLDAAEAAYLLSMAESTFREHVREGTLPEGVLLKGKRLWSRKFLNDALEQIANPALNDDPIRRAIKGLGNGQKPKARNHAA